MFGENWALFFFLSIAMDTVENVLCGILFKYF